MNTKNVSDISSLLSSGKYESKLAVKKTSLEFGSVMEKTLNKEQTSKVDSKESVSSTRESEISKQPTVTDKKVNSNQTTKDNTTKEVSDKIETSDKVETTVKATNEDVITKVTDVLTDVTVDESLITSISNLVDNIEQMLMDKLGLTKEELEEQLEILGLSMIDILQVSNLKTLILAVNGTDDITNFLTDENLANTLSELTEYMKNLEETVVDDIPLTKEQLNELLQKAVNSEKSPLQQNLDTNIVENSGKSSAPEFIVVKEGSEVTSEDNSDANADNQAESQFDAFMNQLSGTNGTQTTTQVTGNFEQVTIVREIVNQIVEQIKVVIKPDQTSMEIQLNPENLGKLHLSVVMKEGSLTAQFTTSNYAVKEVLESQMHILRETLQVQGLKVEEIEVTVSNFEFTNSNQMTNGGEEQKDSSKKRKIVVDSMLHNDNASIEDTQEDRIEIGTSSTLDYSV